MKRKKSSNAETRSSGRVSIISFGASPKGQALIAAVDAGLLPKVVRGGEEGWDTEAFDRFWADFSRRVLIRPLSPTEYAGKKGAKEST